MVDDRDKSEGEQIKKVKCFGSQDVMISTILQESSRKVCLGAEGKYLRQKSFTSSIPIHIIVAGRD